MPDPAMLVASLSVELRCTLLVNRDAEAGVWWATAADLPGLVAEAGTLDELAAVLRDLVPELRALNATPAPEAAP